MAQKKITDLTLRSAIVDSCNFAVDDGIQTFRVTAAQLFAYLRPQFEAPRTISAAGTDIENTDVVVYLDPTSAPFTQALPECSTMPEGMEITFKNIALPSNGNAVTLDANGAQLIDSDITLVLNSSPSMDGVTLKNTGTKWLTI